MAAESEGRHRSGPLKQQNKSHKHGKHKSKGELERDNRGRVNVKCFTRKAIAVKKKTDRKNQAVQLRKTKREEAMNKKRSIGSAAAPPHCVAVISLHASVSVDEVIKGITTCDDSATLATTANGITHMGVPRFKQRVEFVRTEYGNLYEILDAAKVADSVLLGVDAEEGLDKFGDCCMSCLFGQGQLGVTLVAQGKKTIPQKKQKEIRKSLQRKLEKWFMGEKVHSVDTAQESLLVLRHILEQKLRPIHYREQRPYLLAENLALEIDDTQDDEGTLKVTGYVRSQTMSVNRLVHLPGWGDFQLSQIDVLDDPHTLVPRNSRKRQTNTQDVEMGHDEMSGEALSVERPDTTKQESLEAEVVPDPMEGEQTWPTEEELAEAEAGNKEKTVRRVPKGTSEYQASWIVDNEPEQGEEEGDDFSNLDEDEDMEAIDQEDSDAELSESGSDPGDDDEYETLSVKDDKDARYDEMMDMDEERNMLEKLREERSHVQFPDEVDTPQGSNARTRFQKYRGLKSFRTSPWDPKENLPLDYARIFQFHNFRQTAKRVLTTAHEDLEGAVTAWSYVRLHIHKVPKAFMDDYNVGSPVVVFGLLPHEQRMSVVNMVLRKCPDVRQPIKTKERLIFHVGFRRFSACPLFSQHTTGNKHKMERYLPMDTAVVATMYAPITFPPAPVLVFQDRPFGELELVAKGSLMSVDPDRVITKRAVLSGCPLKINKKSCVVRYMFFNREDINWFKPVELRTKWGRRGHIKEPLGTHGHMKCVFDGHLKSQDTILLNLYKRVFPKWTFHARVPKPTRVKVSKSVSLATVREEEDDEEEEDTKMEEGAAFALFD